MHSRTAKEQHWDDQPLRQVRISTGVSDFEHDLHNESPIIETFLVWMLDGKGCPGNYADSKAIALVCAEQNP